MEGLAYRIRTAEPADVDAIRANIKLTMAHPEGKGRREGLRAAVERGELLVLERYDPREKSWRIAGFVEFHFRVDDTLTIRDAGSEGETPHSGIIKQLLQELLRSLNPASATAKMRSDLAAWNEIFQGIPGFYRESSEYRRPHWYNVWIWSRELARQQAGRAGRARRRG
jgi:hypothetical protein